MDEVTGLVAVGTGWVAILMPVFITWVSCTTPPKWIKINIQPW